MNLEKELETKYLRAFRMKTLKELEKEYSKEIVGLYKSKLDSKKREEEFKAVIELYRNKLDEIKFLKQKKEEIIKNISINQTLTEKQNQMMEEYLKELERKKIEFDKFMNEKGKEALNFVKRNNELKNQLKEELYKFDKKREVKLIEKENANKIVSAYKEKEAREKIKSNYEQTEANSKNILYKINQTFHDLGNKIDFSTTRFHNIMIIKHDDQLQGELMSQYLTAQEKANLETKKLGERQKSKETLKKNFETETKLNGKEIIRKQRAQENLKRLEEELNKINQAKKRSKSKNSMVVRDNMVKQSKFMEKMAENMLNEKLKERKANRHQILNRKENFEFVPKIENANPDVPNEDEISEFYREEVKLDLDNNWENKIPAEIDSDIQKECDVRDYHYEEPILREFQVKEEISRLNPVDLSSFMKINYDNKIEEVKYRYDSNPMIQYKNNQINKENQILHHKNSNENNYHIKDISNHKLIEDRDSEILKIPKSSSIKNNSIIKNFDLEQILKNKENILFEKNSNFNQIDPLNKQKASSIVNEFLNDLNKADTYEVYKYSYINIFFQETKSKQEISKFIYKEPKFINNQRNFIEHLEEKGKTTYNSKNYVINKKLPNDSSKEFSFRKTKPSSSEEPNRNNYNSNNTKNKNLQAENREDYEENNSNQNANEFKRDETKWKYSKHELLERRKKMLKDKSLVKKSNK